MLDVALLVAVIPALWVVMALMLDAHGRQPWPAGAFDAIVVLGCRSSADGSPSGHLARRVERAVALWHQGRAPIVVLTGGGEPSEAAVAARHAARLGLPPSVTVLEERSGNTEENARFTASLIEGHHVLDSVT